MDKQFIEGLTITELVVLQHELKAFPEDKTDWELVMDEIKRRHKQEIAK